MPHRFQIPDDLRIAMPPLPRPSSGNPADDRLLAAVLAGDGAAAERALAEGANARAQRDYQETWDRELVAGTESLLLCAARSGHAGIVELLLQRGADANAADSLTGRTPLVVASGRGDARSVRALLAGRASLHGVDGPSGDDAFAAAIAGGHAEIAALLATAGAAASKRALEHCCHLGRVGLAELCLRRGASPAQHAVLEVAARAGHLAMVHWLLAHGASLANEGREALCEAANAGKADVVAFLLEQGVPSDCRTSYGWPPLHLAAYNGDAATVAALLLGGADPRAVDAQGTTALDHAREAGKAENVRLLEGA